MRVSGNLTRDDAPITEATLLRVEFRQFFPPNGVFPQVQQRSVTPDANGNYTLDIVGPRNADAVDIKAWVGFEPEWVGAAIDPLQLGVNPLALSVDYKTTKVQVSGTAFLNGAPSPLRSLTIRSYDSEGNYLGSNGQVVRDSFVSMNPDPDTGVYSGEAFVYSNASFVTVSTWYGSTRFNPYASFTSELLPITPESIVNPVGFDIATTTINVSGNVTSGGVAQGFTNVPLTIAAYTGETLLDEQVLDEAGTSASIDTTASGGYTLTCSCPPAPTASSSRRRSATLRRSTSPPWPLRGSPRCRSTSCRAVAECCSTAH